MKDLNVDFYELKGGFIARTRGYNKAFSSVIDNGIPSERLASRFSEGCFEGWTLGHRDVCREAALVLHLLALQIRRADTRVIRSSDISHIMVENMRVELSDLRRFLRWGDVRLSVIQDINDAFPGMLVPRR